MRKVVLAAAVFSLGLCSCNSSVEYEKSKPMQAICGNGVREIGEACDGTTNLSCARFDASKNWQPGGAPGCSASCTLTQGTCAEAAVVKTCGNGELDSDEPCDGALFADSSQTCETFFGAGATGKLKCVSCRVSTTDCAASTLCGNGQIDAGERCDGSQFGGESCETLAGTNYHGVLSCIGCATIDTTLCIPDLSFCGNGQIDADEVCDGDDIGDATCERLIDGNPGPFLGAPKCNSTCSGFDITGCVPYSVGSCGNYQIEDGEVCDLVNVGDETCESVMGPGYKGDLLCAFDCLSYNTDYCKPPSGPVCNNGIVEDGEVCDGTDLGGATCESEMGPGDVGTLTCSSDCLVLMTNDCELSVSPVCSNNIREEGEECDGTDLGGATCASLDGPGYEGVLSCDSNCHFDTSGCTEISKCGNGEIDDGESCDGFELDGATCASLLGDEYEGLLGCTSACAFDTSECRKICGNGVLDGAEVCDGNVFADGAQAVCGSGKVEVALVCSDACTIDNDASCADMPPNCQNSALDDGEICDPSLELYTPLSCVYKPEFDDSFVNDFYYIRPDGVANGDVANYVRNERVSGLWFGVTACSAVCELQQDCRVLGDEAFESTTILVDTLISKLTSGGSADERKLKGAGFSWNLNSALSVDTDYTYIFGAWKAGEGGLPNLKWYVAYDLTKASATIVEDYDAIAVSVYAVKNQANSIDSITLMLYDGDTLVGKIADIAVGAHGNHWVNSGEITFTVKGLSKPAIRFVSAKDGAAIKLKNLHVTGLKMKDM